MLLCTINRGVCVYFIDSGEPNDALQDRVSLIHHCLLFVLHAHIVSVSRVTRYSAEHSQHIPDGSFLC